MAEEIEVAGLHTKISIDDTLLEKSLASIQRQMKNVESEFKKASSGLDQFGKGAEGLKLKADSLSKQLELQGAVVAKLNKQYQDSVEEKGKDAVATEKLEVRLNNAIAKYNQLDAQLKQTNKELAIQSSEWTKLGDTLQKTGDRLQKAGKQMEGIGNSLTKSLTVPLSAIGGLAAKASIDFESAFAGVRKTVDATEAEFAVLSEGIRKMAREDVPVAATEIAKVAEAAGQLGIQKDAILGFTRTMIDLGVATNLTGDQAATALARLANITQMSQHDFDRLGATIVELGNNLATTEAEIVEMALRLAGAGKQIGLTEAEILAFAGSLSSVGIAAEAGGSAFSRLMINIASEVATNGKKLEGFAATAGMTAEQFRQAFQEDAAGAIIAFIEGLDAISRSGGNVFGVLEDLGLSEIRLRDAILRAANAGDLFRESIELGSRAWDENLALTKEAEQRYATSASQLQMLKNRLADVGITLGDALVPALLDALKAMEPLFKAIENAARRFSELDEGTQRAIIGFAGIAAAAGPTLVVSGKMVQSIGSITTALGKASTAMAKAGGAAAVLSRAFTALTGPVGIAIAALSALVAGGIALNRYMSQDAIPAVQDFGKQASAAAQRASGSFAKFRQGAQADLKQTAQVAKTEGAAIGENVAKGVTTGTSKAKDQAVQDMREMVDRMKETVDRNTSSLNRLGDAITTALKRQYEEMERAQIAALDKQVENERKASDERIRIYDAEYAEKLKLIDEDAYRQIKAIQDQIDAIDKLTEAEDRARREQEYRERIAEYQRQLAAAATEEERAKIQQDMAKTTADYERQILLEQRKAQKEALREQIEDIKTAANERKEQLKLELEEKKAAEKEKLQATLDRLDDEKDAIKEHFDELTEAEALQAEARKLIIEQNNDEIVRLLEEYNPKWQDAGQSFADAFAQGLNSEKQSIEDAVREIVDIAPVIDDQVRELDRLQAKLKELEATAKGSSGAASDIGAGFGGIDLGFASMTEEAMELADTLSNDVQPSMEGVAEAAGSLATEALQAFIGLNHEVTKELLLLKWTGQKVTEETAESIADKFFAMGQTILENLEASHAARLQSMRQFFADSDALTEAEEAEALRKLQENMSREAAEVEAGMNRVAQIMLNALEEKRAIKQSEYDEILRIQEAMTRDAETVLGNFEIEQKVILERMRADAANITARQAAEIVEKSREQRDGAIQAAEEQYDRTIAQIIRMRDEAKVISAEQADALIADAKRQRDESVKHAEQMHLTVVREAKEMAGELAKDIDWATGEVLDRWEKLERVSANDWLHLRIQMGLWAADAFGQMKIKLDEAIEKLKQIDLISVGRNIMDGLLGGLSDKLPELKEKVAEAGRYITEGFKFSMQIRSPSRVMMRLGEETGEGLVVGLENSLSKIRRQAVAMAAAATPVMRSISAPATATAGAGTGVVDRGVGSAVTYNFERMFEGANFNVRSDEDIQRLARELADYIMTKGRG